MTTGHAAWHHILFAMLGFTSSETRTRVIPVPERCIWRQILRPSSPTARCLPQVPRVLPIQGNSFLSIEQRPHQWTPDKSDVMPNPPNTIPRTPATTLFFPRPDPSVDIVCLPPTALFTVWAFSIDADFIKPFQHERSDCAEIWPGTQFGRKVVRCHRYRRAKSNRIHHRNRTNRL